MENKIERCPLTTSQIKLNVEKLENNTSKTRWEGHAVVFNIWSERGWYELGFKPGAFLETIQNDDIKALLNHDSNRVFGRNKNNTLRLSEDERGLFVSIDPPKTQLASDTEESIRRGDINQMSIGFSAINEQWEFAEEKNQLDRRTIFVAKLFDVSVVTYPQFTETDINVMQLSRNDIYAKYKKIENKKIDNRLLAYQLLVNHL